MSALRFPYQSNPQTTAGIHYSDNNPVLRKHTKRLPGVKVSPDSNKTFFIA
jgi:hypothetical protein